MSFTALQTQLLDELKQQEDPRMFGNGHIFDEYPYGNAPKRNFYERTLRGEKITVDKN
jgi:N-sulfoglucosamine sulfohydrolase